MKTEKSKLLDYPNFQTIGITFGASPTTSNKNTNSLCITLAFLLFLTTCLILLLTISSKHVQVIQALKLKDSSSSFLKGRRFGLTEKENDNDMERSASYVLEKLRQNLTAEQVPICLFDTSFFGERVKQYEKEHIQGARLFDIGAVTEKIGHRILRPIHPVDAQKKLRSLGISKDCHVIFADHGENPNSVITATFAYWIMKLYGHNELSIMRGGLKKWKKEAEKNNKYALAVNEESPPPKIKGDFTAGYRAEYYSIELEDVLRNIDNENYVLIDARPEKEFNGEEKDERAKTAGHIKGAINIPISLIVDENGALKNTSQLKEVFNSKAKIRWKIAITYCNSGMQASAVYFALRKAKFRAVVYGGSWIEFSHLAPKKFIVKQ